MTSKQKTVFFEIHSGLGREAPGSRQATKMAYRALGDGDQIRKILDIGCGPGAQALQLAELSDADIHAVDTHEPFIRRLKGEIAARDLQSRVFPRLADMNRLPFQAASFDLIWSEGTIYIAGFEKGLRLWRPLLKPGGGIVVSEISWLAEAVPGEPRRYWTDAYPGMKSRRENEVILGATGYILLDSFVLPESGWWDEYYTPVEQKLADLEARYRDDPEALRVLALEKQEIDMYRRYSDCYGYVFYIARRKD